MGSSGQAPGPSRPAALAESRLSSRCGRSSGSGTSARRPIRALTVCPTSCGKEITLKVGQTYQIWAYNGDVEDVLDVHGLSSVTAIGLVGGQLPQGSSLEVQTVTPMTPGDFPFNCTTFCGSAQGHDGMVGVIHVVP